MTNRIDLPAYMVNQKYSYETAPKKRFKNQPGRPVGGKLNQWRKGEAEYRKSAKVSTYHLRINTNICWLVPAGSNIQPM
jgi:hypothetical protein